MTGENGAKPEAEKKRRPTIVDIANRAGVAPMTVSRIINESGYVSREAREKVERAVKELNYHPNGAA
jgi:DNA-binding LacI/PurR family transcriptional regulator